MLFAEKQALSNVENFFFTNVGGNVFVVVGVESSDLPSSLFVDVLFCVICEGLKFIRVAVVEYFPLLVLSGFLSSVF